MNSTNRQVLPNGLWIVSTPIGNLEDITPRARWALEQADFVLCEDTRRTAQLLNALQIPNPPSRLKRWDAHQEFKNTSYWIEQLLAGRNLALVTDAGTPAVSDPGAVLVQAALEAQIRVTPFPGASAVLSLLSVSGFSGTSFTFRGFFPRQKSERKEELLKASKSEVSENFFWFESPHRILETLAGIREFSESLQIRVGKELTKLHETVFSGSASEVYLKIEKEIHTEGELGEWCLAIQFPVFNSDENLAPAATKALKCLLDFGISASDAAKKVSQEFGIPKRDCYQAALVLTQKKN